MVDGALSVLEYTEGGFGKLKLLLNTRCTIDSDNLPPVLRGGLGTVAAPATSKEQRSCGDASNPSLSPVGAELGGGVKHTVNAPRAP